MCTTKFSGYGITGSIVGMYMDFQTLEAKGLEGKRNDLTSSPSAYALVDGRFANPIAQVSSLVLRHHMIDPHRSQYPSGFGILDKKSIVCAIPPGVGG